MQRCEMMTYEVLTYAPKCGSEKTKLNHRRLAAGPARGRAICSMSDNRVCDIVAVRLACGERRSGGN